MVSSVALVSRRCHAAVSGRIALYVHTYIKIPRGYPYYVPFKVPKAGSNATASIRSKCGNFVRDDNGSRLEGISLQMRAEDPCTLSTTCKGRGISPMSVWSAWTRLPGRFSRSLAYWCTHKLLGYRPNPYGLRYLSGIGISCASRELHVQYSQ